MTKKIREVNLALPSYHEIIKELKYYLIVTGVNFERKPNIFFFSFCYLGLGLMTSIVFYFVIASGDFLAATQLFPCVTYAYLAQTKITFVLLKKNKIMNLSKSLEAFYEEILTDTSKSALVKKGVRFLRLLNKIYFYSNYVLPLSYSLLALLLMLQHYIETDEVTFRLPFAIIIPFPLNTWGKWVTLYTYQTLCGFCSISYGGVMDIFYFTMTYHVCINFAILSKQLEELKANDGNVTKGIVKRHQELLKLTVDLEDIFSGSNFFSVFIHSLNICILGFNLTAGEMATIPSSIIFLFCILLQSFMMSCFGEQIMHESEKVGKSAYLCKWYEMDSRTKKSLMIIRIRAMKLAALTTWKFSVVGYRSFSKILSTSWSYFTILSMLYDPSHEIKVKA